MEYGALPLAQWSIAKRVCRTLQDLFVQSASFAEGLTSPHSGNHNLTLNPRISGSKHTFLYSKRLCIQSVLSQSSGTKRNNGMQRGNNDSTSQQTGREEAKERG